MPTIFIAALIAVFSVSSGAQTVTLHFARPEKAYEQEAAELILKKIYAKLNIALKVSEYPPNRAQTLNVSMDVDGEVGRIRPYGDANPSLVRVEPSYYSITTTGFCLKNRKIHFTTVGELKNYSTAVVRGINHARIAAESSANMMVVNFPDQIFNLVKIGRVDIAFDAGMNGRKFISREPYLDLEECGTVATLELYNYLNQRSRQYAEPVSAMIRKLIRTGELKQIIAEAEAQVLKAGN